MRHLIAIHLQNEAGALTRVTGLISTRGYNIESLSVAPTNDPTVSRITLVTIGSDEVISQINAQLLKLVDVVAVDDMTSGDHLARELMLIKLQVAPEHIESVNTVARRVGGKVLSAKPSSYIVELTSTETEIGEFIANVAAFGDIVEVVRSGSLEFRAPIRACISSNKVVMPEIEVTPEHAADPLTRRVGILVGVVGVLLSVVTIASHRAHTQAVIHRTESNDQWAFYQAKKIRENTSDVALTLLGALQPDAARAEATARKLTAARDKYADDAKDIIKEAQAKDLEQRIEEHRALRFDIGEGLLELGLVLCSLYFLARKSFFPLFGVIASLAGAGMGVLGWLL